MSLTRMTAQPPSTPSAALTDSDRNPSGAEKCREGALLDRLAEFLCPYKLPVAVPKSACIVANTMAKAD